MKKLLQFMKNNIIGFILGLVIAGSIGVYAVSTISDSSEISFDNTNTSLQSTTVESAIIELTDKVQTKMNAYNYIYGQLVSVLNNPNMTLDCQGLTKLKASVIGAYGQGSYVSDGYVYKSSISISGGNSPDGPWTGLYGLTVAERTNVTIDFTGYRYIKISSSNPFGSTKITGIAFE